MKKRRLELLSLAIMLTIQSPVAALAAETDTGDQIMTRQESMQESGQEETEEEPLLTGEEEMEPEQEVILSGTADLPESDIPVMLSGISGQETDNSAEIQEALNKAQNYLKSAVTSPVVDSIGGEWAVMAMARYQGIPDGTKAAYLTNLFQTLKDKDGVLHTAKYTEYSRVVMALSALGMSPSDVNGYNLLMPLANMKDVTKQGINGPIFALIALDANQYEIPKLSTEDIEAGKEQMTREGLISYILSKEISGGGWSLSGRKADADMTGMALQALAPYYGSRADITAAADRGIAKLKEMWGNGNGFVSEADGGTDRNLESAAQVLIAVTSLGKTVDDQEFVDGLLNEVLDFQLNDGSFQHLKTGGSDGMATEQGTLALTAWYRMVNGQSSLYDMTDLGVKNPEESESEENIVKFKEKLEKLPENITLAQKDTVYTLKAELAQLKKFDEKEILIAKLNALEKELETQQKDVETLDQEIWESIDPLNITLTDKEKIDRLLSRYRAFPKENQTFVKNIGDLERADMIVEKLEKGIIGREIFENVKSSRKSYQYEGKDYVILLKGSTIFQPGDMEAGLHIEREAEKITFTTKADGNLPGEITVSMECALKDGVYMLYEVKGDEKKPLQWCGIFDGKMSCEISRGGIYVLEKVETSEKEAEEEKKGTVTSGTKKPSGNAGIGNSGKRSSSSGASTAQTTSNIVKAKVKDGIVAKSEFDKVKEKDKNLKITAEISEGKPYTLMINGKDVKKSADMKIGILESSSYENEIKKLGEKPYIFSFEQKSSFPGEMQVTMNVGKKDGEYLLLKYNPEERKAEFVQKVTVKNNKTKFLVSEGGDYFIAERARTKSLDDLEAAEQEKKEAKPEETGSETEVLAKAAAVPEEEVILAGTKEAESHTGIIAAVIAVLVLLAGAGGFFWYKRKK